MAGRLWMDGTTADCGVLARVAARLALPRAGRDGRPEPGDAVIGLWRGRRERARAESGYGPGVWLMDGRPGLDREDLEQLRLAGVKLDSALGEDGVDDAGGSDGRPGTPGGGMPDGRARSVWMPGSDRMAGTAGCAPPSGTGRLFEVPVFHLKALKVRRVGPGAAILPSDWDGPHPLRRRLEAAAVRALYAAGRDFGTVTLAASDDGAVRLAGPFGAPAERDLPLWLEAVDAFRAELAAEAEAVGRRTILIGADPEFLLVDPDGRVVSASRFFPRDGAAGSDALRVRGRIRCPVAELRPDPAGDPDALARGIRGLMRRAGAMTAAAGRPLRWLAGGMPVPGFALGGHLHLNVPPSARLLRVLDTCVALPLAAAEDARGVRRRPRYGALGDFRVKPHGFEYRTPPSWLVSPIAARAAFAVALLAARQPAVLAMLTGLPSESPEGRRAYYAGDRETLRALALRVHDAMRRAPGYAVYRRWIAPFFAALERGAVWREDDDIRPKWGLSAHTGGASEAAAGSPEAGPASGIAGGVRRPETGGHESGFR